MPQHDGGGPRQEGPQTEVDAVLELQHAYGNQAVAQLLASGASAPPPVLPNGGLGNRAIAAMVAQRQSTQAVVQRLPMDTNPGERVQHLRAAIRFEALFYKFVIDEGKATDALSNMTPDDGRQVKAIYQEKEKRNLGWIFSAVETPIEDGPPAPNNLSMASRTKLLNLLAGTVIKDEPAAAEAPPAPEAAAPAAATPAAATPAKPAAARPARPDAEKVRRNRQRALASSIKAAVDKKDADAAIGLIPDSMDERREIDALYKTMYGKTAYMDLFTKLPGKDGARAGALWYDEKDDADRYAIEAGVEAKDKADKEAKALESSAFGSMLGDAAKAKRQEGDRKLETAVKKVANAGDQTTVAGKQASRERLREIVKSVERGDRSAVGPKTVGLGSDPILKAIAEGNEADEIGARLARADAVKDVTAGEIESALRELRTLAEDEAQRTIDDAKEGETVDAAATTKAVVDGYFARFKAAFNRAQKRRTFLVMMAGRGGTDEKVANAIGVDVDALRDVAGGRAEIDRNLALMGNKGQLDEVSELVFALASKPKDLDRVREILGSKTFTEVDKLGKQYQAKTNHTLEQDLAGTELEQTAATFFNESREDLMEKRALLVGGQWDRELAEKYAPTDTDPVTREAYFLKAEGDFWFRKAGQLVQRVIDNRGFFARTRDWSGNQEKEILDTARDDRWKAMTALGKALAPGKAEGPAAADDPGGSGPDLPGARKAVAELRVLSRRMTHAASIYKEATKKSYEEFVDLVVNAASIAAGLGVTGIWITALRTTAATVGTKLLMKGSDYSVDEFIGDLEGGMAGVAGDFAKLGMNKVVTPYVASKIMRLATKLGMSKEFKAQVAAKLGPLALRQAEHTVGTAVQNVTQGKSWKEGQGWVDRVKGEAIGQITAPIDHSIRERKAVAAAKKAGPAANEEPAARPSADEDSTTGPRTTAGAAAEAAAPWSAKPAAGDASGGTVGEPDVPAPAPVSMALPEPGTPAPKRRPAPPPLPEGAPRPKVAAPDDPAATHLASAKGEPPPPKPKAPGEEAPTPLATGAGASSGGGTSVEDRAKNWVQPDLITFIPAMAKNHSGEDVVLPNVLIHPDIEAQVKIPDLLRELDRTPWGELIADRIRDGRLQVVVMPSGPEFDFGGLHYTGGKTYIAFGGDITETASNALHEGSHYMDPYTPTAGDPRGPSRLGIEADARAWEYEYNELVGRPPRQPAEVAFRTEYARIVKKTAGTKPKDRQNPQGADLGLARREADQAMIQAMQGDPKRYGVESIADEEARLAGRRDPDFLSMQIDNLLPPLPPVPDKLEIESMFGGDEEPGGGGGASGPGGTPKPDPSEWQDAPHGARPGRRPTEQRPPPNTASPDKERTGNGPLATEAPPGSGGAAPRAGAEDQLLVGDKHSPKMKAREMNPVLYNATKRELSAQHLDDIAAAEKLVRDDLEGRLAKLATNGMGGQDFKAFDETIGALRSEPSAENQVVLDHAQIVWDALHDPKLIAEVVSKAYGEALRHQNPADGLDPVTRALLREAVEGGPIYVIPKSTQIEREPFFKHWVQTGRRFYDQIDQGGHGNMTHLIQDLVVDVALKRRGKTGMTSAKFRQALGRVHASRVPDAGDKLWTHMYDAVDSGINQPEFLMPVIREVDELRELR